MPPADSLTRLWHIELLGGLRVVGPERVITRFRSRQTGALLAYLAFYLHRSHPRVLLIELIWPGEEIEAGRDRLRVALSSLRRQLEPPGIASGAVILAGRRVVQLSPAAVSTDVGAFEAAVQAARATSDAGERTQWLTEALERYRGELLPGYYEAWIQPERQRLADLYFQAARELIHHREQIGDLSGALDVAGRAVAADPLREEAHQELIRLYLRVGQPARARRQFRELQQLLRQEWGEKPTLATEGLFGESEQREDASPEQGLRAAPGETEVRPLLSLPSPMPFPSNASPPRLPEGTVASYAGHPPLQITRFFGREAELAALQLWLITDRERLITLTGSGGTGKTRLAIELAGQFGEATQGSVWWVPLADLVDPELIAGAVRDALHLPRSPQAPALEQIVGAFAESRRPALLVLDNFEHLADGGATVVRLLLERVPHLQCLITSRQLLNLGGEREFRVDPLPVPGVQALRRSGTQVEANSGLERLNAQDHRFAAVPPERLMQFASVRLFVDRAQAVRPDFQVTNSNVPAVAELCCRLEGIPLAIELAAARIRLLTPGQMLPMLERRFEFLVSHRRGLSPRHQTLRAAIDWSYRLLSPETRRFFARLSVFRGGWTREAAAAICGDDLAGCALGDRTDRSDPSDPDPPVTHPQPSTAPLETLAQLQECSLVQAQASGGEMRFRMLETLRAYAAEQLTPEERQAVARRHAFHYLALAESTEPALTGPDAATWLDRLEREHDNLRAALDWLAEQRLLAEAMRLALALVPFWRDRYHRVEGRQRLVALIARTDPADHSPERARLIHYAGSFSWGQSDYETARTLLQQGLPLLEGLDDKPRCAQAYRLLGNIALDQQGDGQAAGALYERSLAAFRAAGQQRGAAGALYSLGVVASMEGDLRSARARWEESLAVLRELGDPGEIGYALEPLARVSYALGDATAASVHLKERIALQRESARQRGVLVPAGPGDPSTAGRLDGSSVRHLWEESLAIEREIGEKRWTAWRLHYLADMATEQGDLQTAQEILEECLTVFRELEVTQLVAASKRKLAAIARFRGDYPAARALLEEALALRGGIGDRPGTANTQADVAMLASDQGHHATARTLLEENLALLRELDRNPDVAEMLRRLGVVAQRAGDLERARRLLEESLDLCRLSGDQHAVARALAGLGSVLATRGSHTAARPLLTESLAIRRLRCERPGIAECLEGLAAIESAEAGGVAEKRERAVRLLGAAATLREMIGIPLPPADLPEQERRLAGLRAALSEAAFAAAWADAQAAIDPVAAEAMDQCPP